MFERRRVRKSIRVLLLIAIIIIAIIHNQELLPQPSNKLPNPQPEPQELHPFPPKQKMINKAIITIHK